MAEYIENQDDLAAAWERSIEASINSGEDAEAILNASVHAEAKKSGTAADLLIDRILNQDEIDNLLGFSLEDQSQGTSGGPWMSKRP